MAISLGDVLALVGKLDDSAGKETARERFRRFLGENVSEVGQVRDYVEECLRNSGDQHSRALQDLVNHIGCILGYGVTFGRYQGIQGQIGFDGHWRSPTGFNIVVEAKTTEVYAIKTATLVGYVDALISEKIIPSWDDALGLYIVGRPDPEIRQLENAIVAEKRTQQLRIVSADSLLSLAEMMTQYDVGHEDILELVRPSGPTIDTVVELMQRLVSGPATEEPVQPEPPAPSPPLPPVQEACTYWLSPVKGSKEETAEECIRRLVGEEHIYAFGERTPGRKLLKPGDWICFYATGKGVIAHAQVIAPPERKPHPKVRQPERYPWVFGLGDTKLYLEEPVVIDAATRATLGAFVGRDPGRAWAWFVQSTKTITDHDFRILTRTHT